MKKRIMTVLVVAILAIATIGLVACGGNKDGKEAKMEIKPVKSQIDALMEVKGLTADAAVIDATMAGYLLVSDGSFKDLKIVEPTGFEFANEYYAVAAKKGNDKLIKFVNAGLKKLQDNGKYDEILKKYGQELRANKIGDVDAVPADWKSSLKNNTVVIGYTANAPMGIVNKDNTVTGLDIELAREIFGTEVTVETKLIEWDNKENLLNNGTIDLVWNGLTVTPQRAENMCLSVNYMNNAQAIVVKADKVDNYKTIEGLKGMQVVVEAGSAGAENAELIAKQINK